MNSWRRRRKRVPRFGTAMLRGTARIRIKAKRKRVEGFLPFNKRTRDHKTNGRKSIVIRGIKEARSFSDRLLGLLKKSNSGPLLFKTRFGIHTFGLKKEIDVIVLNLDKRVVKFATVKPNRLFFWNPKYNLILEFPKGGIKKNRIKINDLIMIK